MEQLEISLLFWSRVNITGPDECWLWKPKGKGYGSFRLGSGKNPTNPSRVAWILTYGEISQEIEICHTCDTPRCCNPAHLFKGTHSDNMKDMYQKGRVSRKGISNGRSRFTEAQVIEIRTAFEQGTRICHIANRLKCSQATIAHICHKTTWKHL